MTVQLAVVVLLAALLLVALVATAALLAPHLRTLRRDRVIVNMLNGSAITGVVVGDRGRRLELAQAELHEAGATTAMDGRAVVEKSQVAFVQVLPAREPATGGS